MPESSSLGIPTEPPVKDLAFVLIILNVQASPTSVNCESLKGVEKRKARK
jgi:hypothetical protein